MTTALRLRWLALWATLSPGLAAMALAGAPALTDIRQVTDQLISPAAKEREAGDAWLKAHGDDAFALLAKLIETGEPKERERAAYEAIVLLSPWQRGIAAGSNHHGQIELFRPWRPVARPVDHPKAPLVRRALLAALRATLDLARRDADPERTWARTNLVRALCDGLPEVADAQAADAVAVLLKDEPNRFCAAQLIACLDTVHGLPASYEIGGICGHSTPEELRQFEASETARCNAARAALLDWHRRHTPLPLAERIEAALDQWEARFAAGHCHYFSDSGDWATERHLAPLIRLGPPAVEAIRTRQAKAPDLITRGVYEIAVAAITSKEDPKLIRELLAPRKNASGPKHPFLACEIIAAAGSKAWKPELVALQTQPGYHQKKASYTLAVVRRKDALPLLRAAAAANREDFIAACAAKELESWPE